LAHPSEPEIPSIAKEDIEKALASIEPKETDEHKEHEHASLFGGHKRMGENVVSPSSAGSEDEHHEEEHKDDSYDEHDENKDNGNEEHEEKDHDEHGKHEEHEGHNDDSSSALGFTSIHSLIPGAEDDEEKPKHGDSSFDNGDWQDVAPLHVPQGAGPHRRIPKVLKWTALLVLLVVIAGYLAIDLGLVKSDTNLPFHIFNKQKKKTVAIVTPPVVQNPPPAPTGPVVPDGFTAYKVEGANISLDYPTAWGKPTATADPGFSKRGGTNKTDGTYAYLVNFATNKDVQLAVTSSKYLPAARGAQYYDYLQWCTGTNDGKFYKQSLHFTSASGVDTPGTIACDQGPLADATKLDDITIVQLKTKSADGKTILGDLYTQNLSKGDYAVLRVMDAKMANADNIKKLLGTVSIDSSSSSTSANPQ
jgi:hypothetical protein